MAPQPRSPGSKTTPNIATSKGFTFSRRSASRAGCPNTSARARVNGSAGAPSSPRSMRLRAFFQWLSTQPGYRSHLTSADAEYFALSDKEARIAKAIAERPVPTIDQIRHVLQTMPAVTDIELRNRAVVAFTLLTGARDGAIASLKRKHVDVVEGKVVQDAREVRTKFSKTFTTWFFPVGEDVRQIVVDWVQYLDSLQLFGPVDPLFPATEIVQDQYHLFQTGGLSRAHWSNATPIRTIFKEAFTSAGLAYANPHSFRKTLAQLGERLCRTPEEFKAWSQNLGHEQVLTTFSSYGQVGADRQAELIRHLAQQAGDRHPQGGDDRPYDPSLAGREAHLWNDR